MRAIVYVRVSSDPSGRARSVTEQEAECRALCEREGWTVAEVLTDNDRGASRHSGGTRPAYDRLAEVLRHGDVLVTWEASRAQRDLAAYVALRDLCAQRGVRWHYGGSTFDLGTGDGRFRTGLDALLAENEAEKTRERVLRAQRAGAQAGRWHGRTAYGYKAVRDPDTGQIVARIPDEAEAPIVREAVERTILGENFKSIARDFNARGIPTAGTASEWVGSVLGQMVVRPVYAGLRIHRGAITPGVWEPLITAEQHRQVVAIVSDPSRVTSVGRAAVHLLSGIAVCGVCGSGLARRWNKGYPAYACNRDGCRKISRSQPKVDEFVTEAALLVLEDPVFVGVAGGDGGEAAELWAEVEALRVRLDSFTDQAADGALSAAALSRVESKLLPQIAAAEAKARASVSVPMVGEMAGPNARAAWAAAGVEDRRAVVRGLMQVTVLPSGRKGRAEFDPSLVRIDWR